MIVVVEIIIIIIISDRGVYINMVSVSVHHHGITTPTVTRTCTPLTGPAATDPAMVQPRTQATYIATTIIVYMNTIIVCLYLCFSDEICTRRLWTDDVPHTS